MKQINEALNRLFDGRKQLKQKWIAIKHHSNDDNKDYLLLYHYQHLILVVSLDDYSIKHEWWECPTDKRGLDSAKIYIENKKQNIDNK